MPAAAAPFRIGVIAEHHISDDRGLRRLTAFRSATRRSNGSFRLAMRSSNGSSRRPDRVVLRSILRSILRAGLADLVLGALIGSSCWLTWSPCIALPIGIKSAG
jgi:hypothetical protein